jgi:hypothetical protein
MGNGLGASASSVVGAPLIPSFAPSCGSAGILLEATILLELAMGHSSQGIDKPKGEEQPVDKRRAQTVHQTSPRESVSHEATRDPKLSDANKREGSS